MKRPKIAPLLIQQSPAPLQVALDDKSVPDEIKLVVSKGNVESHLYYAKKYGL